MANAIIVALIITAAELVHICVFASPEFNKDLDNSGTAQQECKQWAAPKLSADKPQVRQNGKTAAYVLLHNKCKVCESSLSLTKLLSMKLVAFCIQDISLSQLNQLHSQQNFVWLK